MPNADSDVQRAKELEKSWAMNCSALPYADARRIGIAYLEQIKGLSSQMAEKFAKEDREASALVGATPDNIQRFAQEMFWREVFAVLPPRPTDIEDEIKFLLRGGLPTIHSLLHILIGTRGGIFDSICTNWHVYK